MPKILDMVGTGKHSNLAVDQILLGLNISYTDSSRRCREMIVFMSNCGLVTT